MGQRLIISIYNRERELLATQYMHWSAYTGSTLDCFDRIREVLEEGSLGPIQEEPEYAVRLLRTCFRDAALTEAAAEALGTKEERTLSRNAGLIDITPEEMDDSIGWGEGFLSIYLDSRCDKEHVGNLHVFMDVCSVEEDIESGLEFNGLEEELKFIPEFEGEPEKLLDKKDMREIPCHECQSWPETFDELGKLERIYSLTYSDGYAYCHEPGSKKNTFLITWVR